MEHTPADDDAKIAEIKRELRYRELVYPKRIQAKKLSRDRANRQYFVLLCILEDYTGNVANSKEPRIAWDCPVCGVVNFTPSRLDIVHCKADTAKGFQACDNGPFYLHAVAENRRLKTVVKYMAHRIEGLPYHPKQTGIFPDNTDLNSE